PSSPLFRTRASSPRTRTPRSRPRRASTPTSSSTTASAWTERRTPTTAMRPPRPAARHRGAAPVAQGLGDPGIDAADTDLADAGRAGERVGRRLTEAVRDMRRLRPPEYQERWGRSPTAHATALGRLVGSLEDRKSTRLNSSHVKISYAVFCTKK